MVILVLNSGSSSIKYKLFNSETLSLIYDGIEENVVDFHKSFENIFNNILSLDVIKSLDNIKAVGHRVVHGGEIFVQPVLINNNIIKELEKLIPLAPLHNPSNIDGIKIVQSKLPNIPQVAVFDTAFHHTLPTSSFLYPIPLEFYENNKIRKYGFHGTSHQYIASKYAQYINKPLEKLNLITLHLGNGASICAIKDGKSIDTSMGFTPLEGLMMGTRSGDIDPSIVLYMQTTLNLTPKQIDDILNKQSGLKGLCGKYDLRDILEKIKQNDKKYIIAFDIFIEKIRKYLGSYLIKLGKVDAIIFTGGIGEHSFEVRDKVCDNLFDLLSLEINKEQNIISSNQDIRSIASKRSKIDICIINTNEEKSIAMQTKALF